MYASLKEKGWTSPLASETNNLGAGWLFTLLIDHGVNFSVSTGLVLLY